MSDCIICESAGKTAGNITRSTSKKIRKVKGGTMSICRKVGNLCKSDLTRIEGKRKKVFLKLGDQVWELYQDKIFKSVFEQEKIKQLVSELEGCENEIKEIRAKTAAQNKQRKDKSALRKAAADLRSDDKKIRKAAIRVLDRIGGKEAITILNKALKDSDPEVCQKAAAALHRLVDNSVKTNTESSDEKIEKNESNTEEELRKHFIGGNWYEINGEKVRGKNKAIEILSQLKKSQEK